MNLSGLLQRLLPLLVLILASSCASEHKEVPISLAVVGGTVITMQGEPIRNGIVVVENGSIVAVGRQGEIAVPAGAQIIDASDRYIVPGLVDMHVHLSPEPGEPGDATWRQLRLMVANGVTTARSMSGQASHPGIRDSIIAGDLIAPNLYVASPPLHSGNTPDVETARVKVIEAAEQGFDLVKAHQLEALDIWQAVQVSAAENKIPVAGHLTTNIPLEQALNFKQQVEHLDGFIAALLEDDSPSQGISFGQIPPPAVLADVDRGAIRALARNAADMQAWVVPTLALFEMLADTTISVADLQAKEEMKYVPQAALDQWAAQREQLLASGIMQVIGRDFISLRRTMTYALHSAGVGLMAGSDTSQSFHLTGFALHDELASFQLAGLSPEEALSTATVNPRRYFETLPNNGSGSGKEPNFGLIAPGNSADLLLLNGNPLEDVAASSLIDAVILRGTLYDRAALDNMLAEVAASVEEGPESPEGAVILIRHAETGSESNDPPLSDQGRSRARRIAEQLNTFGPQKVYVTPTRRARETGGIIAGRHSASLIEYAPSQLNDLSATLLSEGGRSVVIGHTNTTPLLADLLGGLAGPRMDANEYDRIYQIELPDANTEIHLKDRVIRTCVLPGVTGEYYCGNVNVLESEQSGRELDIHFAVLEATGANRLPPLLMAPGGPGLGGVDSAAGVAQEFASFRVNRDIWLMDQRGTGRSNRLDCPLPADLGSSIASLSVQKEEAIIACRESLLDRADLRAYTTPAAVSDLEEIRKLLNADEIDIFGMSYGTRIALDYGRQFPEHLRTVVIRSPAPAAMQLPLHTPYDAQRSLEQLMDVCQKTLQCAEAYPELESDFQRVLNRLNEGPVVLNVINPADGQLMETAFDSTAFGSAMFFYLYLPELYRQIPALITAAAHGDFRPLVQGIAPMIVGTLDQVAWGLRWSVICNEDVDRIDRTQVTELTENTFMGDAPVQGDIQACDLWPAAQVAEEYFEAPELVHPVLIISGTMDPVAPPRWGDYIVQRLNNALHLPITGASHLPVFPGCTRDIVNDFLDRGGFEGIDTECAERPVYPIFQITERDAGG